MANNVLFISEQSFKEESLINQNVDDKKISPLIKRVQKEQIQQIIGSGIYNEICDQITGASVDVKNKTLLDDYIQPVIVRYVEVEFVLYGTYNMTNKGVNTKSSDNAQPASMSDILTLRDELLNEAQFCAERLTRFLIENESTYPLFCNPGEGCDVIRPLKTNYRTGIAGI
jgi:hypothetical protein